MDCYGRSIICCVRSENLKGTPRRQVEAVGNADSGHGSPRVDAPERLACEEASSSPPKCRFDSCLPRFAFLGRRSHTWLDLTSSHQKKGGRNKPAASDLRSFIRLRVATLLDSSQVTQYYILRYEGYSSGHNYPRRCAGT